MGSGSSTLSNVSASGSLSTYTSAAIPGKVKALVIGINYTGTDNELRGCISDANKVSDLLSSWGYSVTKMTDLSSGDLLATKANILAKLHFLLSNLTDGDSLVIYFSGHGALVNDTSGDEGAFGKDSVILPSDYATSGSIIDDELRIELLKATQGKVFCFFDSCNSGSMCDLRFNILSSTYRAILSTKRFYDPREWKSVFKLFENTDYALTNTPVLSLSGSRDSQLSYEIYDTSSITYGGVMTFAALKILNSETPKIKITDFASKVIAQISAWGYGIQTPQLMSGQSFDQNTLFSDYIGV
jgi:hypothetical protein